MDFIGGNPFLAPELIPSHFGWSGRRGSRAFHSVRRVYCIRNARRHHAKSPKDALSDHERPLVVYLRSFVQDGMRQELRKSDQFLHPVQYRVSQTVEERLVKHIGTLGPVVAIGRPKERLPLIGAARLYVDDADWQNVVDDLLRRARLVLIQAGESPGLQWELNKAVERLNPEQLLIFLPSQLSVNKPNRQNAYLRFRGWASHYFPLELPETAQDAILIRFLNHPRWQPGLVSRQTVRTRRDPTDKALYRLVRDKSLKYRRKSFIIRFGLLIIFLIILFTLISRWC